MCQANDTPNQTYQWHTSKLSTFRTDQVSVWTTPNRRTQASYHQAHDVKDDHNHAEHDQQGFHRRQHKQRHHKDCKYCGTHSLYSKLVNHHGALFCQELHRYRIHLLSGKESGEHIHGWLLRVSATTKCILTHSRCNSRLMSRCLATMMVTYALEVWSWTSTLSELHNLPPDLSFE